VKAIIEMQIHSGDAEPRGKDLVEALTKLATALRDNGCTFAYVAKVTDGDVEATITVPLW